MAGNIPFITWKEDKGRKRKNIPISALAGTRLYKKSIINEPRMYTRQRSIALNKRVLGFE